MSHTSGKRADALRRSLVAVAALGILAGAGLARAETDVATPDADRVWGGCELEFNTLSSTDGTISFDFLVLYSSNAPTTEQSYSPIVCTALGVSIQSLSEAVDIPNSQGKPPGISVDILPSVLGTAIRYKVGPSKKSQLCHQSRDTTECYTIETGSYGSSCTILDTFPNSTTVVNTVVNSPRCTAIANAPGLPDGIRQDLLERFGCTETTTTVSDDFSAIVAYRLDSSTPPKVCATQTYKRTATDEILSGNVVDAQNIFALRYEINGPPRDGEKETRLCHTVADNTDCFRVYK